MPSFFRIEDHWYYRWQGVLYGAFATKAAARENWRTYFG